MGRMALVGLVLLAACGRGAPPPEPAGPDALPLVPSVARLEAAPAPGGTVLRATAVTPTQGWHSAALVPLPDPAPGVLAFGFTAAPPDAAPRVSTERSREITVARFLGARALRGVREIRVIARGNAARVAR